ncbi:MAG TPA: hypothetical protein VKJ45_21445, partial [Blastocatellia bacterium]|nr:hypothetical protein [Blastocatellia bacterium]
IAYLRRSIRASSSRVARAYRRFALSRARAFALGVPDILYAALSARSATFEANGNIYVGFASFCDFFYNLSRGWVLGWNVSTLKPLAANQLNDDLAQTPNNNYFLSSVWMSGNGLAESPTGGIFFATGNSNSGSYNSVNNLSESVVNMSSDLSHVTDFFTPSNVNTLDANDGDLASGGVLLVPTQSGPIANSPWLSPRMAGCFS